MTELCDANSDKTSNSLWRSRRFFWMRGVFVLFACASAAPPSSAPAASQLQWYWRGEYQLERNATNGLTHFHAHNIPDTPPSSSSSSSSALASSFSATSLVDSVIELWLQSSLHVREEQRAAESSSLRAGTPPVPIREPARRREMRASKGGSDGRRYQKLNALLDNVTFVMPDQEFTKVFMLASAKIKLHHLVCGSMSFQEALVESASAPDNQAVRIHMRVSDVDITCSTDWAYTWGYFSGSGKATVEGAENAIDVSLVLASSLSLDRAAPSQAAVQECKAQVHFKNMEFTGGITASILDTFEQSVRTAMESELTDIVCQEVRAVAAKEVGGALANVSQALEAYLPPNARPPAPSQELAADAFLEGSLPEDMRLLDLQKNALVDAAIKAANTYLSSTSTNISALISGLVQSLGGGDSGTGRLVLEKVGWTLYESKTEFRTTSITIRNITVLGLDTITQMGPVRALSGRTLAFALKLDRLEVQVTADVKVDASKGSGDPASGSILHFKHPLNLTEHVDLSVPLTSLAVDVAVATALDLGQIEGTLELGLQADLVHCLQSSLRGVNLTVVNASIGDVDTPRLTHFFSPEFRALLEEVIAAGMLMYKGVGLLAFPAVMQTDVRHVLNEDAARSINRTNRSHCAAGTTRNSTRAPYDLREAEEAVRFIQGFMHIPQNISQWPPLEVYLNGTALMEDNHDPEAEEAALLASWPKETTLLDLTADKTVELLVQAGSGLLDGDGIRGALMHLTHDTGEVHIHFGQPPVPPPRVRVGGDFVYTLTGMRVSGLGSVHNFHEIKNVGRRTIAASLVADSLEVTLEQRVRLLDAVEEMVFITMRLDDVSLVAHFLLGAESQKFNTLTVKQLQEHMRTCLVSAVDALSFSSLNATVGSLHEVSISGVIVPESHLMDDMVDTAVNMFQHQLVEAAPAVVQTVLRAAINHAFDDYIHNQSNRYCPEDGPPPSAPAYYDFQKDPGGEMKLVSGALNQLLNVKGLNQVVGRATASQSGVEGALYEKNSLVETRHRLASLGHLYVQVKNFSASHLNSLHSMELLEVTSPYTLLNSVVMGEPRAVALAVDVYIEIVGIKNPAHVVLRDNLRLILKLRSLEALAELRAMIDENRVKQLQVRDLRHLECWVPTTVLGLTKLNLTFGAFELHLDCLECTSPGFKALQATMQDVSAVQQVTGMVNAALARASQQVTSDDGYLLKHFLEHYFLNPDTQCAHRFASPPSPPNSPPPPPSVEKQTLHVTFVVAMVAGGTAFLGAVIVLARRACLAFQTQSTMEVYSPDEDYIPAAEQELESAPLPNASSSFQLTVESETRHLSSQEDSLQEGSFPGSGSGVRDGSGSHVDGGRRGDGYTGSSAAVVNEEDARHPPRARSLSQHPEVPWLWRVGLPVWLLANIAMFLSGHLSLGAEVDLQLWVAGSRLDIDDLFVFSLGSSLRDMWTAGAYQLALLIGTFSGAWPYLKLLLMGYCWCTPVSRALPAKRRGAILMFLDVMGKWSFIDLYVLVLTMMAFRLKIVSPPYRVFPADFYDVNLQVTPVWGLYAFVTAAISSLVVNHVALHFHRVAIADDAAPRAPPATASNPTKMQSFGHDDLDLPETPRASLQAGGGSNTSMDHEAMEAVNNHVFTLGRRASSRKTLVKCTAGGRVGVVLLLLLSLGALVYGAVVQSYQFTVEGLAGMVMHAGERNSHTTRFSMLNTASHIRDQAGVGDNSIAGIWYIAAAYLLSVFVAPFCQLVGFLLLWTVPLTLPQHRSAMYVMEVVSAWSSVEVFLVAVVVALLEIGQVSKFMVDDACNGLEQVMKDLLVPYHLMKRDDATCFYVEASIFRGCYFILLAVALATAACQLVRRCSASALQDRERCRHNGWVVDDGTGAGQYSPRFLQITTWVLEVLYLIRDAELEQVEAAGDDHAHQWVTNPFASHETHPRSGSENAGNPVDVRSPQLPTSSRMSNARGEHVGRNTHHPGGKGRGVLRRWFWGAERSEIAYTDDNTDNPTLPLEDVAECRGKAPLFGVSAQHEPSDGGVAASLVQSPMSTRFKSMLRHAIGRRNPKGSTANPTRTSMKVESELERLGAEEIQGGEELDMLSSASDVDEDAVVYGADDRETVLAPAAPVVTTISGLSPEDVLL